ncbi:MAG: thioesterase family protein [Gammaproteobacteria bacterium]|nr:thioesterase family protein [Gammaproteobacteria bacterium]
MNEIRDESGEHYPEGFALLRDMFEQKIAFNRLLGLKILSVGDEQATIRLQMRDEFIGNYSRGILHGGVISATLDATAGLAAFYSMLEDHRGESLKQIADRFAKVGTIDMRVDYLRPGRGRQFIASARILRKGSRVAVIHTEMHDENGEMIASGTCTYMVG